jgi:hypothetical protein
MPLDCNSGGEFITLLDVGPGVVTYVVGPSRRHPCGR